VLPDWEHFCVKPGQEVDWRCRGLNACPSDPQSDDVTLRHAKNLSEYNVNYF